MPILGLNFHDKTSEFQLTSKQYFTYPFYDNFTAPSLCTLSIHHSEKVN
jgi:hypothetical protein